MLPRVFRTRRWIDEGTSFFFLIDSAASSRICDCRWCLEAPVVSFLIKCVLQTRTAACHPCRRQHGPADSIVYSFSAANSDPLLIVSLQSHVNGMESRQKGAGG